jgi:phenylalanine-4-hydroxylase
MSAVLDATDVARTSEDAQVWSLMVARIGSIVDQSRWHHPCYVHNFDWLRGFQLRPPSLREINDWLKGTNWRVAYVDGYVPADTYRRMHADWVFPAARPFRALRNLEHSVAPDFVHDVLGHLPMLFDDDYAHLLQRWGERAKLAPPTDADRWVMKLMAQLERLRIVEHPDVAEVNRALAELEDAQAAATVTCSRFLKFETFYTWAVEFGILRHGGGGRKLIGAAALSSPGEMANIFSGKVEVRPFLDGAVGHPVDYTQYQTCLFEARSFEDYFSELEKI